ncbi:MAG: F0F1 ATP synthase subunit B [Candidatus Uhrbacteria bacterium]|nr:F0F1 ATP synthase subunit B [Candidatus Uhrbacteria bacterium]
MTEISLTNTVIEGAIPYGCDSENGAIADVACSTIDSGELTAEELNTEVVNEETGGIAGVAGQFGLKGDIFLAQLVNFLIVLVILWIFLYKPVLKFLNERQEKIEKSVKHAEEIEKRVKAIDIERESIVTEARQAAQTILEKAQADSKTRSDEMVEAAKREVERVITRGKEQLAGEKTEMMRELRKEVVALAVKAAERILTDGIDEKKSQSLAEEVVRKLT